MTSKAVVKVTGATFMERLQAITHEADNYAGLVQCERAKLEKRLVETVAFRAHMAIDHLLAVE
jgi:hypothetical protein